MLKNQKYPGEGTGSKVDVTTTKVNPGGGHSVTADNHAGNADRGNSYPASWQADVDDKATLPLHSQVLHLDRNGHVIHVEDHDNSNAPGALGHQPVTVDKAQTLEYDSESNSHKPAKKVPVGGITRTSGAVGAHYHNGGN